MFDHILRITARILEKFFTIADKAPILNKEIMGFHGGEGSTTSCLFNHN